MTTRASLIFIVLLGLFSVPARAHELSALAGGSLVSPGDLNAIEPQSLNVPFAMNYGADGIYDFASFGIGVRYDSVSRLSTDGSKDGDMFEFASHTFSVMARKRWEIDGGRWTPSYVSVLGAIGVYAPSEVATHAAGKPWVAYKTSDVRDFQIGAQTGFIWSPFLVGLEVGYQYLVLTGLGDINTGAPLVSSTGAPIDVNLCGPYAKFILGLYF